MKIFLIQATPPNLPAFPRLGSHVQHGLLDTQTTQKSCETIDPGWEDILQMAGRLTTRKLTYPTLVKGKSSTQQCLGMRG